jgi:hypothetical protein
MYIQKKITNSTILTIVPQLANGCTKIWAKSILLICVFNLFSEYTKINHNLCYLLACSICLVGPAGPIRQVGMIQIYMVMLDLLEMLTVKIILVKKKIMSYLTSQIINLIKFIR